MVDTYSNNTTEIAIVPPDCIEPAAVNGPAPDLVLMDSNGVLRELSSLQGNVVLVNLWATWCPPCVAEMPLLEGFHQEYSGDGLSLIGVNAGEERPTVLNFIEQSEITFPIWFDPQEESIKSFQTFTLPTTVVIDREGDIRYRWSGETCWEVLETTVVPLIYQ
jgi:thiol-disulfide isomerase/thioredoxin